jgi:hypothetical protein
MTRPEPVRFLRTEATMAYPAGRLIAMRDGYCHVLAADGWTRVDHGHPAGAVQLTREDAEDWCDREGWEIGLLDEVPRAD